MLGEFSATLTISFKLPLQCNTKLQPAVNALFVFSAIENFKDFIDKSSEIINFLKPIDFLIKLIIFF